MTMSRIRLGIIPDARELPWQHQPTGQPSIVSANYNFHFPLNGYDFWACIMPERVDLETGESTPVLGRELNVIDIKIIQDDDLVATITNNYRPDAPVHVQLNTRLSLTNHESLQSAWDRFLKEQR